MQLKDFLARIKGDSQTVGLDVGHRYIKIAVVQHRKDEAPRLLLVDKEPTPDDALDDNELHDPARLAPAVQKLLQRSFPGGVGGDIVLSLNWTSGMLCDRLVVKKLPKVSQDDLILQAAMGRPPFDDPGNVLDYCIMSKREDSYETLIVAAKSAATAAWANAFVNLMHLKLAAIDIDAFAACNAYFCAHADEERDKQTFMMMNIGSHKSHISYVRAGMFHMGRGLQGVAVDSTVQMVAAHLGITPERCEAVLSGGPREGIDEAQLMTALEYVYEEFAMGIETALRYFSSSESFDRPEKLYLVGGGAHLPEIARFLTDRANMEALVFNPLDAVENSLDVPAPSLYTPAIGLALRKF
jgi:type IV pilus assembly protein PilM